MRRYVGFLWKRIARIYPVHLVMLSVTGALMVGAGLENYPRVATHSFSLQALLGSLALVHAWTYPVPLVWNAVSWSISAEWGAYLAFPAIAALAMRVRSARAAALIIVLLYAALGVHVTHSEYVATTAFGMARIAVGFSAGVLLYRISTIRPRSDNRSGAIATTLIVALVLVGNLQDTALGHGTSMALMPILACLVVQAAARVPKQHWLSSTVATYLGRISYSLYMVHMMVLLGVQAWLIDYAGVTGNVAAVIGVLASVALADVLYRFVELPCRQRMLAWFTHGNQCDVGRVNAAQ